MIKNQLVDTRNIRIGAPRLEGTLILPKEARGLVIFAHGSGSSRLSPRNQHVAELLNERNYATILFDLLTDAEAVDRHNVFDISLLASRMRLAVEWALADKLACRLRIGLFGASTGAAAALCAAAELQGRISAIVSRGGRPDLAGEALPLVSAPTLLIVGGADTDVIALNEMALARMTCERQLKIVPGATHLFEEKGTLDQVVRLAADWYDAHLPKDAS